ncbi:hypothetical protein KBZ10_09360 [Streptomyces sp. F63]|uniref:hypothetical protein n=1 Tax=Streptomyces sp. F63 TaxID=2824887 RepID=UPI001B38022E|nr:hypothetical protein [Streptomyces sp. F63]MBQ0984720.1 hypothetical protein [Streptomyces sp. F63]
MSAHRSPAARVPAVPDPASPADASPPGGAPPPGVAGPEQDSPAHRGLPAFDEFIRPLSGGTGAPPSGATALGSVPVGDFAVLAWLDDVQACHGLGPEAEAELLARWDSATLHDVYALLRPDAGTGGRAS